MLPCADLTAVSDGKSNAFLVNCSNACLLVLEKKEKFFSILIFTFYFFPEGCSLPFCEVYWILNRFTKYKTRLWENVL